MLNADQLPPYTASGVGAFYPHLPKFLGPLRRKAAARAVLRHEAYTDDKHFHLKRDSGLHTSFVALHNIGDGATAAEQEEARDLLEGSLEDTYNALTVMDRIDGGVTLLLRCPGYRPPRNASLEDITLDVYFSPRELDEGGRKFRSAINVLMQNFANEIVLPHLKRFAARCDAEGIRKVPAQPPYGLPLSGEDLKFPDAFPKGSSRFRCRCRSPQVRNDSAVLHVGTFSLQQGRANVDHRSESSRPSCSPAPAAIISIGSNTDAAIDRFGFEDSLIPQLHNLVTTVRSSKWEAKLRSTDWGLSFEQAVSLSNALLLDLEVAKLKAQPIRNANITAFQTVLLACLFVTAYFVIV